MAMSFADLDSEDLLRRVGRGDAEAREQLFTAPRRRLRQMIALRMDPRLRSRIDPSDVLQEALAEAFQQLPDYLQERPLPFYPWLRQIAWNRLVDLHRRHLLAQRRSVLREQNQLPLPDNSAIQLAEQLIASGTTPSGRLVQEEVRGRVQAALLRLKDSDRELLVLRYLERLSTAEIACVLGIREGAVKVRHFRAIERLRTLLDGPGAESDR
jgi:RNA polymerase sigma-70 factor (ECF subfamily)